MHRLLTPRFFIGFLLSALLIGLDGCKKDDTPAASATVAGTYKIGSIGVTPAVQGTFTDIIAASKLLFNNTTCLTDIKITFNVNNTATTDNPASCQSIPVATSTFTGIDASSKWTQSGTTLTVTKSDNTSTNYTIVSNTGTVLTLQWQGTLNYPTPSTTVYTYTMVLNRQ